MRAARLLALALPLFAALLAPAAAQAAPKPAYLELYSGWAGPNGGFVYGRAHHGNPQPKPLPGQSSYQRLKQTIETLETEALPGATVAISGIPGLATAKADQNGFLKLPVGRGAKPGFLDVTVTLTQPGYAAAPAKARVQVFDGAPGYAVISDIDDTLLDTGVTHKLKMLANTLFRSTWELKTFPGAAQAVSAGAGLRAQYPTRPFFMVSGSPWGLTSRISEFFDRSGFARGAIILRRYSQESLNPFDFKHPHLLEILDAFPQKKFILYGDTGEKDPEVYAAVMKERPGRVAAVYIHNVTKEKQASGRFANMKLFGDWPEVGKDLAARKLGL